jgi:hypothetical protein
MTEIISFKTETQMNSPSFEKFLYEKLGMDRFRWCGNFFDHCIDNQIDVNTTYISLECSANGFKYHYAVYDSKAPDLPLNQRVDLLKDLSRIEGCKILSPDDEINPWSWVLIEPTGEASTIETINEDLVIADYYNFPFGDFRTVAKLTDDEITILKGMIKDLYPVVEIFYSTDGPIINGEFNKVKTTIRELNHFDYHYEVRPVGKNRWLDKGTKSQKFIALMSQFHRFSGRELCIFPRNFSEIKNIEGGSDSEEYCIVIKNGQQEKIVYKYRRKSWLR